LEHQLRWGHALIAWCGVYGIVGLLLSWFGFSRWHRQQVISDALLQAEYARVSAEAETKAAHLAAFVFVVAARASVARGLCSI
jgi:hypothetical protein